MHIENYAPYIVMGLAYFIQNRIFATPADIERALKEVYKELADNYVRQSEMAEIKEKINKIYDHLIGS